VNIHELVEAAHLNAVTKGFWDGAVQADAAIKTVFSASGDFASEVSEAMIAQKLALIHAEVSEALEARRKGDLENLENFAEELADAVIRIADLAGYTGIDLEAEIKEKMTKNASRPRLHGKLY
jgi:NTP pyrophosphatase (non-canonical NTP hydrolase)